MKYALLVAAAALFAGPALAHRICPDTQYVPLQGVNGNFVGVNPENGAEKTIYLTPNCKPLMDRNGVPYGSTGVVQTNLDDGRVLTELPPVVTTPVITLPLTETPLVNTQTEERLLATPVVPVTSNLATPMTHVIENGVTNNYYGNVYYGRSWWNAEESYYTPPFTLADLQKNCPSLDVNWAARALPYYATHYSYFQLWRMDLNWNEQHDYEETCQIFSVPYKPIPTP